MKDKVLLLIIIVLLVFPGAIFGKDKGGFVAGEFDSYVFALSWEPVFCETKMDKSECRNTASDAFDASNLVLHGLWPNKNGDKKHQYGYCGVSPQIRKMADDSQQWCDIDKLALSSDVAAELPVYMPGFFSCLERHEWYKHGVCTGMGMDEYFKIADALTAKMARTKFGKYLSGNVGKTVALTALLSAFEADFGPGSGSYVSLKCADNELSAVEMYLIKAISSDKEMPEMLLRDGRQSAQQCPSSVMIQRFQAVGR